MKLKIYLITVLAVVTVTSCELLRKDKLSVKNLSEKQELQGVAQKTMRSEQNQLVLIDSSHHDFTMMLWPKGKFTFSLTNGFEGEAEKILIKGKQTQQKLLNMKHEKRLNSAVFKVNYSNQKQSSNSVQKNKINVGYNWGWVLVLLVIFVLIWVYMRFKPIDVKRVFWNTK